MPWWKRRDERVVSLRDGLVVHRFQPASVTRLTLDLA